MKLIRLALAVGLALWAPTGNAKSWIDQSFEIFLTPNLKSAATSYRDFPLFWWNFLIFEPGTPADAVCREIGQTSLTGIRKLPCDFKAENIRPLAEAWLEDTVLRRTAPSPTELKAGASQTLAKASLPIPRDLLEWLRKDPLNELDELKSRLEKNVSSTFERRGSLLIERESGRILMPLQFDFPPNKSQDTQNVMKTVAEACARVPGCESIYLLGSHAGNMENEMQIRADIEIVSKVGLFALAALFSFILLSRRYRLFLLFPLMAVGILVAGMATISVFGNVHAITLSFGPGLIGLSLDYGIHAAFLDPRSRTMWKSNLIALLTTLVILVLLGFSSIPLLKQMMFFAVTGLVTTFVIFYIALSRRPKLFQVTPFRLKPKPWRSLTLLAGALVLCSPLVLLVPLRLDLQYMNFATSKTQELQSWFFQSSGEASPYIIPEEQNLKPWADQNGIRYEGVSQFLPAVEEQKTNLSSWSSDICSQAKALGPFFSPFHDLICRKAEPYILNAQAPRPYLADFTDGRRWIGVLFPSTSEQIQAIQDRFAHPVSPREMISQFPRTFSRELSWMIPTALLGALLFLFAYYRSVGFAILAATPFLSGVGAFAIMTYLLNLPLTFISLMGLLMVFGFSLDYGVFAVNLLRSGGERSEGVWSALTLCALTTIAGFTPMAMGHHPVLHNLGHALLWGSIGTYVGALWAVPSGYRLWVGSVK